MRWKYKYKISTKKYNITKRIFSQAKYCGIDDQDSRAIPDFKDALRTLSSSDNPDCIHLIYATNNLRPFGKKTPIVDFPENGDDNVLLDYDELSSKGKAIVDKIIKSMEMAGLKKIDTMEVLRACKTSEDQSVLDRKFTDIFLVFDIDPHDSLFDGEKLVQLAEVFCESTDVGKLYINYPMMESLKHIRDLWSCDYLGLMVGEDGITDYKRLVGEEGSNSLKDLGKVDRRSFDRIVLLNLLKADKILGGEGNVPDGKEYGIGFYLGRICRLQTEMWLKERQVWVLNTSVFCVIDFRPQAFLSSLIEEFGDAGSK